MGFFSDVVNVWRVCLAQFPSTKCQPEYITRTGRILELVSTLLMARSQPIREEISVIFGTASIIAEVN